MESEFEKQKSESFKRKHRINCVEAQALLDDSDRIEIPARIEVETRILVSGKISGKHWSALISYRGENVQIISVRRSGKAEIDMYES